MLKTPYGYEVHKSLQADERLKIWAGMLVSRMNLVTTTTGAGLQMKLIVRTSPLNEILLRHLDGRTIQYLFNVSNSLSTGNFTSQERKWVLGQSGDGVFERHYQSEFVQGDLQHVVLLRPSQEGLLRQAGSMLRNRDP